MEGVGGGGEEGNRAGGQERGMRRGAGGDEQEERVAGGEGSDVNVHMLFYDSSGVLLSVLKTVHDILGPQFSQETFVPHKTI